jgi:hypothetical protein
MIRIYLQPLLRKSPGLPALILTLAAILLLTGCASPRPSSLPLGAKQLPEQQPELRWYRARFQIAWPEGAPPELFIDTFLAHQIIAPLLRQYREPYLWRFHRRAARDSAGHGFSYLFLVDENQADWWCKKLEASLMVKRVLKSELVERFTCKPYGRDQGRLLASTSDPIWPEHMQRSWPYFIHGLSRFWLGQVEQHHQALPPPADNIPAMVKHYQQVEQRINDDWQIYGRHALLHHLSAIYGYVPGF